MLFKPTLLGTFAIASLLSYPHASGQSTTQGSATAQTGSGTTKPSGSQTTQQSGSGIATGSMTRSTSLPVALQGYCPVCIIDLEKWVKGDPKYSVVMDGKTYLFPGEDAKQKFLKRTTKYTPALSGDCIVCAVDKRVRRPGSVNYASMHKGRLYLFPDQATKDVFMNKPEKYENAELAMGGRCVVCKVEMKKDVPGKEEFGTVYGGIRFLFPSMEQKKMFLTNPKKYLQP